MRRPSGLCRTLQKVFLGLTTCLETFLIGCSKYNFTNLQTCRRAKRGFDVIFERLAMSNLLKPRNVKSFSGAQCPMFERRAENFCFVALQKLLLSSFLRCHQWIAVDCPTHGSTHPKLVSASSSVIAQLAELPPQRRRSDQISGISG